MSKNRACEVTLNSGLKKSRKDWYFDKENIDIKKVQAIILFSLLDLFKATFQGARHTIDHKIS
jgi:hypothetical protein